MKTTRAGQPRRARLYQNFKSAEDIGRTINRSRTYVFKALKTGFSPLEEELLEAEIKRRNQ